LQRVADASFFIGAIRATMIAAHPVKRRCHKEVWSAFGAFGTDPVHHLAAACRDLVRIKTCSPISLKALVVNFHTYVGLPAVMTIWAEPMHSGMTACQDLVWGQPVSGCIPVDCHS